MSWGRSRQGWFSGEFNAFQHSGTDFSLGLSVRVCQYVTHALRSRSGSCAFCRHCHSSKQQRSSSCSCFKAFPPRPPAVNEIRLLHFLLHFCAALAGWVSTGRLPALFKVGLSLAGRSQLPTGFPARPARRSWPAQAACTLGSSGSSWSQCCSLRSPPLCSPSSLLRQSILTVFVNRNPRPCFLRDLGA